MITLFSAPKPFRGHIKVIQTNALQSWNQLSPRCEIILFGDEEGIPEAACWVGGRHIPQVARNEYGTPLLDDVFARARAVAKYDILCYVNADIILLSDLPKAVGYVQGRGKAFLMVGRRWNIDLTGDLNFCDPSWQEQLRKYVKESGKPTPPEWIDYFVFPRDLYKDLLPLALGRAGFDNWLLWKARSLGALVADASHVVMAVHQNHDYSHHPQGKKGVWEGPEAIRNRELMGGLRHCFTLADATHELTPSGLKQHSIKKRLARRVWARGLAQGLLWLLIRSQPLRYWMGLRRSNARHFLERIKKKASFPR
jgi:hypothetical protein